MNRRTLLQSVCAIPALLVAKVFGGTDAAQEQPYPYVIAMREVDKVELEQLYPLPPLQVAPLTEAMRCKDAIQRATLERIAFGPPIPDRVLRRMGLERRAMQEIASLRTDRPPMEPFKPLTDAEWAELAPPDDWEDDDG